MRRNWTAATLATVSIGALALTGHPGLADLASDKARVDSQVSGARDALEGATAEAAAAGAALAEAEARLGVAQQQVAKATAELGEARAQESVAVAAEKAAEAQLAQSRQELVEAQLRVDAAVDRIEGLARAAYTTQSLDTLSVALTGESPSDLPVRLQMIESVASGNRRLLADVAIERSRMVYVESQIAEREAALQAQRQAAAAASRSAAEKTDALVSAQSEVAGLVAQREAAARAASTIVEQERARVAELEAESARLADLIRASSRPTVVRSNPGGRLFWPTAGGIGSPFGMRFHPILHYWRLHAGADIGGATGNPIYAADDGVVIWAGRRGGYGNATIIDHGSDRGRSLVTVYGHQSSIGVRVGQRVARGEVIGRVGSTGLSTTPHLHFEVRLDGKPVDPAPWLR